MHTHTHTHLYMATEHFNYLFWKNLPLINFFTNTLRSLHRLVKFHSPSLHNAEFNQSQTLHLVLIVHFISPWIQKQQRSQHPGVCRLSQDAWRDLAGSNKSEEMEADKDFFPNHCKGKIKRSVLNEIWNKTEWNILWISFDTYMRKKNQVVYKPERNVSKQKIQMSLSVANQKSQMLREQILPSITSL